MTTVTVSSETPLPSLTEERVAWLALAFTPQLGPRRILRAVERCGSAAKILRSGSHRSRGSAISRGECAVYRRRPRARCSRSAVGRTCARPAANFSPTPIAAIPNASARYSIRLWCSGFVAIRSYSRRPSIAVVGTRHPTPYGTGMAEMLSRDLAHRGLIIVSGMARGVDTAAHKGALAAKRPTVAVWGTGIDVIYPKENKSLSEQIVGWRRRHRFGVSAGRISRASKFSQTQPHPERDEHRRSCNRSGGVQRNARDCALRHRAEPRRLCGAGQCHDEKCLGP